MKLLLMALLCLFASAGVDARLMRFPDVSADHIVFVYSGDIWIVAKSGGQAYRLSTPEGTEAFPRFSPDGKTIAFSANYDGNDEIYTLPITGGVPKRLTFHPQNERVLDWHPNGERILFASGRESGKQRFNQLYLMHQDGGQPEKLQLPYGEFGMFSSDGNKLAYMPVTRDFRTWKRYRGGSTTDIWLYDLKSNKGQNISTVNANDSQPMWYKNLIYFISDRGQFKRFNIWCFNTENQELRQITKYKEHDIHFPSIGPDTLVYEQAGKLFTMDLTSEKVTEVDVKVVVDQDLLRPRVVKTEDLIFGGDISPSGNRVVFEARGELFSVPKEKGYSLNLTQSSGAAERFPQWSPDGKWIAYFSDRSGEYELCLRSAQGESGETVLTKMGPGFRYTPHWSPDSNKLAWIDQSMRIHYYDRQTQKITEVQKNLFRFEGGLRNTSISWSKDSRWMTFTKDEENTNQSIVIYDTDNQKSHSVTSDFYSEFNPVFDASGEYIFFSTNRHFQPIYSDYEGSFVYPNATQLAVMALKKDSKSILAPENDWEEPKKEDDEDKKEDSDKKTEDKKDDQAQSVTIDFDGLERRVEVLDIPPGNYGSLQAVEGKFLFIERPNTGSRERDAALRYYDVKERKVETIISPVNGYAVSADGKSVLVGSGNRFGVLKIAPNQKLEKPINTGDMMMTLDPKAEWRQIFNDAWRLERDYFYDPNMHGVDWEGMRKRYSKLLNDAATREDLNFIIGEMIAELNVSHSYRGGGDLEREARMNVGLLGADFRPEDGHVKISRIVRGAAWDTEVRSPLDQPGLNIQEGDYLLAVNGVRVKADREIWAYLQGFAGKTVSLRINSKPEDEGARNVLVTPLGLNDDLRLRNLAWIESNRKKVEKASNGKVGYIYVPSTGIDGQNELVRMFYGQFQKQALVIDERFNNGGQIPDRFVELLNRPVTNYWGVRDGKDWQWPQAAHQGPKVMLMNEWSGSGGVCFPYYFRKAGLGPLIGTTTWGGLIGISGAPQLIDGGVVTVPTFSIYTPEDGWVVEPEGVHPDIEVDDDPSLMLNGGDPQLDKAIEVVLEMLAKDPPKEVVKPAYPDRSGY